MELQNKEYSTLTPEEKKIDLYLRQKRTLDLFLERHAISQAQYDKSLGDLTEKMGMSTVCNLQSVEDKQ
ncbi:MAG: hypothetical protein IKZ39_07515 [Lachnospiraceae bacterium]|nr:hypothetical protein [Lachnospiraceae bacterium]